MKKINKNQGITLIALVITIIVMLILVGVSISMAVNGGLFNYAGKAVGETKNAINAENKIGEGGVKVDNQTFNSLNEYIEETKKEKITFKMYLHIADNDEKLYYTKEDGSEIFTVDKGTTWKDFIDNDEQCPDVVIYDNWGNYAVHEEGYPYGGEIYGTDIIENGEEYCMGLEL